MKFETFCKKSMPYVTTSKVGNQNWLHAGHVYMRIPMHMGTISTVITNDKALQAIMSHGNWFDTEATVTNAYLKEPGGKANNIIRVFSNGQRKVSITNAQFALIETKDVCYIAEYALYDEDTEEYVDKIALLVGKYVGDIDDFEPDGIILGLEEE